MVHPPTATINQLFEGHAARAPGAVALVLPAWGSARARALSYREVDERAAALASRLRTEGIVPGQFVGVMMHRSPEMIVAMLAILRCGAAYVPLEPAYPTDRLRFMVTDAGANLCLTDAALVGRARECSNTVLVVDERETASTPATSQRREPSDAGAPAYVMYTSGSTGRPKGVVVPHRAIVRLVKGQSFARLDATRVLLHLAPASFDASTFEIWGALLNGGRCVLAPETGIPDLTRLREVIAGNGVSTVWLTASLFNTIVDHAPNTLETVSEVLTGGEALSEPHIRRAHAQLPNVQFINGYGPTESTTFACCYRIPRPLPESWRSIPIGAPIANTTAHVLDGDLRAVGGEEGDLYIGGQGLALGYLNLPDLTAERFITTAAYGRLYRTGDRARVRADGTLDFLGRVDDQVKIRGYRIELGEVEAALRAVPGIANAVVAMREDVPGDKRLVAYYTLADCIAGPSARTLRESLTARLPEYMVPSVFALLDEVPLTPNGKVDRRALPEPERRRPVLDRPVVAPRTPLEHWIAAQWREVLQIDQVGVLDRFFELGGTSIAAMRFLARLNEETSAPLPALLLFRAPTVAGLSIILEQEYRALLPRHLTNGSPARIGTTPLADRAAQRQRELTERRLRRRSAN